MNKSFTLIEILIVIVVIGILSSFILVGMNSITSSANIAKSKAFSESLRNLLLIDLVSEWKLDGNGNDSWGINNGTLVGPTHLPVLKSENECISGTCYEFDGSEDYINFNNPSNLNNIGNEITISLWSKATNVYSGGDWQYDNGMISHIDSYDISTDAAASLRGWLRLDGTGRDLYGPNMIQYANKWSFIVLTYKPGYAKLYLNSQVVDSDVYMGTISASAYNFCIGWKNNNRFFEGYIDEVLIFDKVMEFSKINEIYFFGLNKLYKNNGIGLNEFNQRVTELRNNLAMHE